jgi:hypothetical protein
MGARKILGADSVLPRKSAGVDLPERLLNEYEAAEALSLSVKTLRRWRWARQGVAWVKLGSAVRYAPADLRAFAEAGRQQPETT